MDSTTEQTESTAKPFHRKEGRVALYIDQREPAKSKMDAFFSAVKAGNYKETAAAYAGLSISSINETIRIARRNAEKGEQAAIDFLDRLAKAEAHSEILMVGTILKAAAADPKHAEWWLTHKYPHKYGTTINRIEGRVGVHHTGGVLLDDVIGKDTTAEDRRAIREHLLAQARAAQTGQADGD